MSEMIAFLKPDPAILSRRAAILADIADQGVTQSIYVQTNWAPGEEVNETRWVQGVADAHGWPAAIIACADLADPNLTRILDAHGEFAALRGIRQQLQLPP